MFSRTLRDMIIWLSLVHTFINNTNLENHPSSLVGSKIKCKQNIKNVNKIFKKCKQNINKIKQNLKNVNKIKV